MVSVRQGGAVKGKGQDWQSKEEGRVTRDFQGLVGMRIVQPKVRFLG